jgi:hypothetical protein
VDRLTSECTELRRQYESVVAEAARRTRRESIVCAAATAPPFLLPSCLLYRAWLRGRAQSRVSRHRAGTAKGGTTAYPKLQNLALWPSSRWVQWPSRLQSHCRFV